MVDSSVVESSVVDSSVVESLVVDSSVVDEMETVVVVSLSSSATHLARSTLLAQRRQLSRLPCLMLSCSFCQVALVSLVPVRLLLWNLLLRRQDQTRRVSFTKPAGQVQSGLARK